MKAPFVRQQFHADLRIACLDGERRSQPLPAQEAFNFVQRCVCSRMAHNHGSQPQRASQIDLVLAAHQSARAFLRSGSMQQQLADTVEGR